MNKSTPDFLEAVQSRAARAAVGISTVRGNPTGTLAAARSHLTRIDLAKFGVARGGFSTALNRETQRLRHSLPKGARSWGLARKILNIFLRDCLYTTYLDRKYRLHRAEAAMEIPLDALTAKGLRRSAGRGVLPEWPGVKHLTPELSSQFQASAASMASQRGMHRIHLDSVLWSKSRD